MSSIARRVACILPIFGGIVNAASTVQQAVKYGETTLAGVLHALIAAACFSAALVLLRDPE